MKLYNSASRQVEEFVPVKKGTVGMYTCGPTVYDYDHIGHGRKYTYDDLLRRIFLYQGYEVNHVQNITDVGHLVSDGDEGEDKLEKGSRKAGKTAFEVADFFTEAHFVSMDKLNILRPTTSSRATQHITEQIELVSKLVEKGFGYDTPEAVYFDVTRFSRYASLFGRQALEDKQTAVREEVHTGEHKRNPADFALWFKRVGRFSDHQMHWDSPFGDGFPGWHIECSAMAMRYLGESFDIHTGGEDNLPVHHVNEIAQSEAATGKPFAKYWLHYAFLTVDGAKMSKSLDNFYRVEDVEEKGYNPLALRYLYLTAHYRSPLNFTWSSLSSAQTAYDKLVEFVKIHKNKGEERTGLSKEKLKKIDQYRDRFLAALGDDLAAPAALAVMWEMLKSNIPDFDKLELLLEWDQILGLDLANIGVEVVPEEIHKMGVDREVLRRDGKFVEADNLRMELEKLGWAVLDTSTGTRYKKLKGI
ncbi:MAG: cysteine--tRNA ligase [Patescibacteria group bacterium]